MKAGEVGIKSPARTYKQELITAAAWSKDPTMVNSYLVEPELCLPDGTKYPNPLSDLHLITAMNCVAPSLPSLATIFVGKPEWEWRKIADKSGSRKSAKSLNFGSIYLMSALTAAENFCVKLEVAKSWLSGHRTTFPGYYAWAEEYGAIAAARGFAISPVSKLIRWVGNFLQPRYQVIGG